MNKKNILDIKKIFLIERSNFDFCYEHKEACEFSNWYNKTTEYLFFEVVNIPNKNDLEQMFFTVIHGYVPLDIVIPIGSVDFVKLFYKVYHGILDIPAINIPKKLLKYEFLKRNIYEYCDVKKAFISQLQNGKEISLNDKNEYFIKEKNIKGIVDIGTIKNTILDEKYNEYIISECVNFTSEYRCFVFRGKLLDCRCYLGDFQVLPDFKLIEAMIKEYGDNNLAYTLDVGIINEKQTALIECHDFFSCGLYGFSNNNLLRMSILTHNKILKLKE